ncbi:leucine zipper protein 2 isoform X3 [Desmodus rotundus]|uniref:leucine zipper protein 2 isoform X3 n=1 Tax=Desmodus rotundus TaxID=9430 RepID=UPI0023815DA3|nr:leucine zipper protein 2 isoform X3 [Desmodus rotundus]
MFAAGDITPKDTPPSQSLPSQGICPFVHFPSAAGESLSPPESPAPRRDRTWRTKESKGNKGRRTLASDRMKFSPAHYLLPLLPALVLSTRQDYEELQKQLREVFKERSTILRQLTKTSRELDGIKVNLQSLKNEEKSAKTDVQKLLEIGQKQREQMKSLQEALQNQLKETSEKAEKQQATINFLKTEMERKSKMIRDLQNENKSLKNKLLSGNKLCGIHAEESKKIQAQLKELRYGKKDLLFKAQQLTDLEQKLAVARNTLEKAALDRESQLKAMKQTVQLCLSTVFRDQSPPLSLIRSNPTQMSIPPSTIDTKILDARTKSKLLQEDRACSVKRQEKPPSNGTAEPEATPQKLQVSPCAKCEVEKTQEKTFTSFEGRATKEEKIL